MKKLLFLFVLVAFFTNVKAQSATLKTSPAAPLAFGIFNVCYETVINETSSIQVSVGALFNVDDIDGTALNTHIGYRYYFTKKEAPRGFYVMSGGGAVFGDMASSVFLGIDLGYQQIWENGIVMDIGLGPQYYFPTSDNVHEDFEGLAPNVVFSLGYAF